MKACAVIAAAGSGQRMQGIDKIMLKLCNKEVISYSISTFDTAKCVDKIVIVSSKQNFSAIDDLVKKMSLNTEIKIVEGSTSRQKSVICGLKECGDCDCIMIHDAARPMLAAEAVDNLYNEVMVNKKLAAALGVRVKDTVKVVNEEGIIVSTPKRETLFAVQTPQAFEINLYKSAVQKALDDGLEYTDDCQLVEALGSSVYIVNGDYKNIKITTPEDIITAENFLKESK